MTKRLTDASREGASGGGIRSSDGDLREWCWQKNRWARNIGWSRWYWVKKHTDDDGKERLSVEVIEGVAADEVWTILNGKKLDYMNWSMPKLEGAERKARFFLANGTPEPQVAA